MTHFAVRKAVLFYFFLCLIKLKYSVNSGDEDFYNDDFYKPIYHKPIFF